MENILFRSLILTMIFLDVSCGRSKNETQLTSQLSPGGSEIFCVQTFNAYGPAYSTRIEERTKTWAKQMVSSPCSIIQAQEIWVESHFEFAKKYLRESLTSMSAVRFDEMSPDANRVSGLALFTDEFVESRKFIEFRVNHQGVFDGIRRTIGVVKGMGVSQIKLRKSLESINFINLHTHPGSSTIRLAQMIQLASVLESMLSQGLPIIISGDFNFTPNSLEYKFLTDALGLVDSFSVVSNGYSGHECTYCRENPHYWGGGDRVIDFIFTRSARGKVLSPQHSYINLLEHSGVVPSDHYGLKSSFAIFAKDKGFVGDANYAERKMIALRTIKMASSALERDKSLTDELEWSKNFLRTMASRLNTDDPHDPWVLNLLIP